MNLLTIFILLMVCSVSWCSFEPLQVMCEVNGKMIPAIVDTGAEISVMSTFCARRCDLWQSIDTQHSGRAIGVGSSDIIGGIEGLGIRIGPLSFQNKISILRNSNHRCDFIIGLDILKRFNCDIIMRERVIKMYVRGNEVRIPLVTKGEGKHASTDLTGHFQSTITKQQQSSPTNPPIIPSQPSLSSTNKQPLSPPVHLDEDEDEEFDSEAEYSHYVNQRKQASETFDGLSQPSSRRMEYVVNRHCYDDSISTKTATRRKNMWSGSRLFHTNTFQQQQSPRKEYSDPDLEKYMFRQRKQAVITLIRQQKQQQQQQQQQQQHTEQLSHQNKYVLNRHVQSQGVTYDPSTDRYANNGQTSLYTTDMYEEHDYLSEEFEAQEDMDKNHDIDTYDNKDCEDCSDLGTNEDFEHFHERHRDRSVSMEGV